MYKALYFPCFVGKQIIFLHSEDKNSTHATQWLCSSTGYMVPQFPVKYFPEFVVQLQNTFHIKKFVRLGFGNKEKKTPFINFNYDHI